MVRGQCANLARMPGLHPYSFSKDIFHDHRESGPRFNVLSEGRYFFAVLCPLHNTGVLGGLTQTTG